MDDVEDSSSEEEFSMEPVQMGGPKQLGGKKLPFKLPGRKLGGKLGGLKLGGRQN